MPMIVDAGANVGCSSIFLRDSYPIGIAVEPDRQTFDALQLNCADLDRVTPVHGALWSHDGEVALVNSEDPSWARAVSDGQGARSPS